MKTIIKKNTIIKLCLISGIFLSCDDEGGSTSDSTKNQDGSHSHSKQDEYNSEYIVWKAKVNDTPEYTVNAHTEIDKEKVIQSGDELIASSDFFKSYNELFYYYKVKDRDDKYIEAETGEHLMSDSNPEGTKTVSEIKPLKIEAQLKDQKGPIKKISVYKGKNLNSGEYCIMLYTNDSLPTTSSSSEIELYITNKKTSTKTKKKIKVHSFVPNTIK